MMRQLIFPRKAQNINSSGALGMMVCKTNKDTTLKLICPIARVFRIVDLMHEAIHNSVPTTKRYYCLMMYLCVACS